MGSISDLSSDLLRHVLSFLSISSTGGAIALSSTNKTLQRHVAQCDRFEDFSKPEDEERLSRSFPGLRRRWISTKDASVKTRKDRETRFDVNRLGIKLSRHVVSVDGLLGKVSNLANLLLLDLSWMEDKVDMPISGLEAALSPESLPNLEELRISNTRIPLSAIPSQIARLIVTNWNVSSEAQLPLFPPRLKTLRISSTPSQTNRVRLPFKLPASLISLSVTMPAIQTPTCGPDEPPVVVWLDVEGRSVDHPCLRSVSLHLPDSLYLSALDISERYKRLREISIVSTRTGLPGSSLEQLNPLQKLQVMRLSVSSIKHGPIVFWRNLPNWSSLTRFDLKIIEKVEQSDFDTLLLGLDHLISVAPLQVLRLVFRAVRSPLMRQWMRLLLTCGRRPQLSVALSLPTLTTVDPLLSAARHLSSLAPLSFLHFLDFSRCAMEEGSEIDLRDFPNLKEVWTRLIEYKMLKSSSFILPPATTSLFIKSNVLPSIPTLQATRDFLKESATLDVIMMQAPGFEFRSAVSDRHHLNDIPSPPILLSDTDIEAKLIENEQGVLALVMMRRLSSRHLTLRLPLTQNDIF